MQYTTQFKKFDPAIKTKINYGGNSSKTMHLAVEASLKKLRTSYIDLLYVHWWGYGSSIEEVMNSLHNLVASGKVLYLGVSDTPAWVVADANRYARDHGKTPFVIYQGRWNVLQRDFEREIIPMARSEGTRDFHDLSVRLCINEANFVRSRSRALPGPGWRSYPDRRRGRAPPPDRREW